MTALRTVLVVALGCIAASCLEENVITPSVASPLLVHAVLNPLLREQTILVERISAGQAATGCISSGDVAVGAECNPERGAHVSITTADGVVLTAIEDVSTSPPTVTTGLYRISLDAYGIALTPGATYRLRVETAQGEVVTGSTTVPAATAAPAQTLAQVFNADHDTLRVSWPSSPSVKHFQLQVNSPFNSAYSALVDGTVDLPGQAYSNDSYLFIPGFPSTVSVVAIDDNYYDYYRTSNNLFTGRGLISSVTGAIGLFGSVAVVDTLTVDVGGDASDDRDGLYQLTFGLPTATTPLEMYIYVSKREHDQLNSNSRVTGNFSTPTSSGRSLYLSGQANEANISVSLGMRAPGQVSVKNFSGAWSGNSIVGRFSDSPSAYGYTKR